MKNLNKKLLLLVGGACGFVLIITAILSIVTIKNAEKAAQKMIPEKLQSTRTEETGVEEDDIEYEDDGSNTEYEAGYNDNGDGIRMKRRVLKDEETGIAMASVYVPDEWEASLNMNWQNVSLNNPVYGTISLTSPDGVGVVLWTQVDYKERKTEFAKAEIKEPSEKEKEATDKKTDKKDSKKDDKKEDKKDDKKEDKKEDKKDDQKSADPTQFKPVEVEPNGGVDYSDYVTSLSYMTPEEYTSYFMQSMKFELTVGKVEKVESDALDEMKKYAKAQAEENMRDINAFYEANMGRKVTLDDVDAFILKQNGKAKIDSKDIYIETICKEYMWDYRLPLGFDATTEATGKDLSCHEIYWSIPMFSLYVAPTPELYAEYYDVYQILIQNMGITKDFSAISEKMRTILNKKMKDGENLEKVCGEFPKSLVSSWDGGTPVKSREDLFYDDYQSDDCKKNMKDKTKCILPEVSGNIFSNGKYLVYSVVSDYHPGAGYELINE